MENVEIIKVEPIMMGKAMSVTLSDGRSCTAWADKINPLSLKVGLSQLEIKPYTSKTGKTGLNIVAVGERQIEINPSLNKPVADRPLKDDSIVAQVLVKCATEIAVAKWDNDVPLEQFVCSAVNDLYKAYKFGVSLLEKNG